MKRGFIILGVLIASSVFFVTQAKAAGEAAFSVTSSQTSYSVGDDIQLVFSVDAGSYASTLSAIDMTIGVSDASIIAPKNTSSPFATGQIYTQLGLQSVNGNEINVVVNVDPNNKPASRSGVIGTIDFTALKSGQTTISFSKIEATEETQELTFVPTTASSLTLNISDGTTAASSISSTSSNSTVITTPTTTAQTGPEQAIAIALLGGTGMFIGYKRIMKISRKT